MPETERPERLERTERSEAEDPDRPDRFEHARKFQSVGRSVTERPERIERSEKGLQGSEGPIWASAIRTYPAFQAFRSADAMLGPSELFERPERLGSSEGFEMSEERLRRFENVRAARKVRKDRKD